MLVGAAGHLLDAMMDWEAIASHQKEKRHGHDDEWRGSTRRTAPGGLGKAQ
jgi:hypothetical protein